ncbi:MAG: hypothetical protein HY943_20470 [Gammaproteobacteria bacterium]|nr:hypothetical protein [Gammaproteobacteria bacterium]
MDGVLARLVEQEDAAGRAYEDALRRLSEGNGEVAECARWNACAAELAKAVELAERRAEDTRARLSYATHDPQSRRGALQTQLSAIQEARGWVGIGNDDRVRRARASEYLEKALAASPEDFADAVADMVGRSMVREIDRWRQMRMTELPGHAIATLDAVGAKAA